MNHISPTGDALVDSELGLRVDRLTAGYSKTDVITDISLDAPRGCVTLLLGRNGSGKSTLLKAIFGLVAVRSGDVTLGGEELTRREIFDRIRAGVRYVPQNGGLFASMRVRENLNLAAGGHAACIEEDIAWLCEMFPALEPLLGQRAGDLSGGQQRLAALAMGLVTRPQFLLADEPSAGLSPRLASDIMRHFRVICERTGAGVLLAEQNVRAGCEIADDVCVLRDGRLHWSGRPREFLRHPTLSVTL